MRVKLKDVCEKATSNLKQSDILSIGGTYPVYGASGYLGNIDSYHQDKPYIAVVKDGAGIGRTTILPPKSSVIGTMQYLIPKENVMPEYLYYVVKHMRLQKYYTGATIPHIYFKDYQNEEFNLADSIRQREIVKVLKNVEDTIRYQEIEINKFDELIKARFIEMFGRPFINNLNWESKQIKNVVNEVKYGTSKPSVENGEYKYLRMNNLTYDGRFDLTDLKFISLDNDELEKCVVRKGDVLFNRTNSLDLIGKTADFDFDEDMVIAGYIIRIRLKETIVPKFFSMYMNTDEVKLHLRTIAKGAVNQANINAQELQGIPIYIPPIELQKQFADFVKQVDKSRFDIKKSIIELEREVVYD